MNKLSYIPPNSDLKILKGIPLDPSYGHTLYFSSKSAQTSYFLGKTKHTYTNLSYQRQNKGTIRVQVSNENLFDCNYLMFRNTSYGDKWFYAFIMESNYINNNCCEIVYQIDYMQTWFFDYELEESFVEREHSASDNIGEHVEGEQFSVGNYVNVSENVQNIGVGYIILATEKSDGSEAEPITGSSGLLKTLQVYTYDTASAVISRVRAFIQNGFKDSILSIFLGPTGTGSINIYAPDVQAGGIDGYTPKNKKLYTYPYTSVCAYAPSGESVRLAYEMFDEYAEFYILHTDYPAPCAIMCPYNYEGIFRNLNYAVEFTGYPSLAVAGDAFQAWLAQTTSAGLAARITKEHPVANAYAKMKLTELQGGFTVGGAAGAAALGTAGVATALGLAPAGITAGVAALGAAGVAALGMAIKTASGAISAGGESRGMIGSTQCGSLFAITDSLDKWYVRKETIRKQDAKIIDDFFTAYGYSCGRVKVPNRNVRKNFTYTKTAGCNLKGTTGLPGGVAEALTAIYDNGITFWNNPSTFGNYSVDNSPN